jgi:hypothetical protein
MANLLNYQPSSYQTLIPNLRITTGMYGSLSPAHYDRFLSRVVLNSINLSSADLGTPGNWSGPQSQTVIVQIRLGQLTSFSSLIDGTPLGDSNVAEYAIPILIPKETEFSVYWQDLLPASSGKVSATLGLSA